MFQQSSGTEAWHSKLDIARLKHLSPHPSHAFTQVPSLLCPARSSLAIIPPGVDPGKYITSAEDKAVANNYENIQRVPESQAVALPRERPQGAWRHRLHHPCGVPVQVRTSVGWTGSEKKTRMSIYFLWASTFPACVCLFIWSCMKL